VLLECACGVCLCVCVCVEGGDCVGDGTDTGARQEGAEVEGCHPAHRALNFIAGT
jgi:hypothetical protein